jgi:hypothetical protein
VSPVSASHSKERLLPPLAWPDYLCRTAIASGRVSQTRGDLKIPLDLTVLMRDSLLELPSYDIAALRTQ